MKPEAEVLQGNEIIKTFGLHLKLIKEDDYLKILK
jgi:hypothetical protein